MANFIEVTRVYIVSSYSCKILLNVDTIQKIEPLGPGENKPGSCRIVLDRKNEDNTWMVMYVEDLYTSISHRLKKLTMSGTTIKRNKKNA